MRGRRERSARGTDSIVGVMSVNLVRYRYIEADGERTQGKAADVETKECIYTTTRDGERNRKSNQEERRPSRTTCRRIGVVILTRQGASMIGLFHALALSQPRRSILHHEIRRPKILYLYHRNSALRHRA